jgi:mono/diheme cytochrome c family protein
MLVASRNPSLRHVALAAAIVLGAPACQQRSVGDDARAGGGVRRATPFELAGQVLARELGCLACHVPAPARADASIEAPALVGWSPTRDEAWLRAHLQHPTTASGAPVEMRDLYDEELQSLAAWVTAVRDRNAAVLGASPAELEGGWVFFDYVCTECHAIAGAGGDRGPDLSEVGARHSRAQLREQILYPKQQRTDSEMPTFAGKIADTELAALLDYLTLLQ